ncbi:MAG: DUF2950 domain-containing protein [Limisphaerales bacterium]
MDRPRIKTESPEHTMTSLFSRLWTAVSRCRGFGLGLAVLLASRTPALAAEAARTFSTPEAAVAALSDAVTRTNRTELLAILGPGGADLVNPDVVQAAKELAEFARAFAESNRLVQESEDRHILEIGSGGWPFPVPLVGKDGGWSFDTEAGKAELLNRRIGGNELRTLEVMRAFVQAQREYASRDLDDDEVLEFAPRILSTPGTKDGLYWPPELDGGISPMGPLVAAAQGEGYLKPDAGDSGPRPYQGYLFRVLDRQGAHAPGGKYRYVINGNMIGGFALLAWPVGYGETGIMTFIVNQQGRVYQKDLGPRTGRIAPGIKAYDPDPTWSVSQD